MKKIVIALMLLSLLALPLATFATPQQGGVNSLEGKTVESILGETGVAAEYDTQKGLLPMIGTIIRLLLTLLGVVVLILIIYAGFMWMTAGGNTEEVDKAKKWLTNAIIGLAIILAAYAISGFVIENLHDVTGTVGQ